MDNYYTCANTEKDFAYAFESGEQMLLSKLESKGYLPDWKHRELRILQCHGNLLCTLFLNVLTDCLFFSAKRRPIMLTWITEKDFHQADVRQNLLYHDLEVLGGGKRGKALPLNQIFPTLVRNMLPVEAERSSLQNEAVQGRTTGKALSSDEKVHEHMLFSTAPSGKYPFFPGATADSHGYTAALLAEPRPHPLTAQQMSAPPDSSNGRPVW